MPGIVWEFKAVRKLVMPQLKRCRDKDLRVKVEFLLYGLKLGNIALASKRFGFGRTTYYKWRKRLIAGRGRLAALSEHSRRPKSSPSQLPPELEQRIRFFKRKGYGAQMIQEFLRREGNKRISLSTINHVVNHRRPSQKKKRVAKLKKHRKRYELAIPGQRLQVDVKYVPMLVQGQDAFVYVAIDECTRWRFARAYPALNEHWTIAFLDDLIDHAPFPIHVIQTDNGTEFTYRMLPNVKRPHDMDVWCQAHQITHRLIPPGMKELNGKVERSHRVDADYFYGRAPTGTFPIFNKALMAWINFYNEARPHGGIQFMTPIEKLAERLEALKRETFTDYLEVIRQKFLKDAPRMGDELGRSLLALELDLLRYNLLVAS